jgi:O-methyltransferase involved in polyketide biosynthesis
MGMNPAAAGQAGGGNGAHDDDRKAVPPGIDISTAHPARVYDYWLGGKDNFAADREAAELALQAYPELAKAVQSNRAFLARAVRYLTGTGIRQFLDIGTGIPAASNTHQVAQREAPDSRVVYVDNDPVVLLHAQALLKSTPQGVCDYIQADLRDPGTILTGAARTLDFGQPVALMLLAILQFIPEEEPYALVSELLAALPSGSYLVVSHPTDDFNPNRQGESIQRYNERVADQATLRGQDETRRFFDGLDIIEPGVVAVSRWRPDSDLVAAAPSSMWSGVARKP